MIDRYRERLLDLSKRNPLISFKFSERGKYIRLIDELPEVVFDKLSSGQKMVFQSLDEPDLTPADENEPKFRKLVEKLKKTDEKYLQDLAAFEGNITERDLVSLEWQLRDRIRTQLHMSPIHRGKMPDAREYALKLGLNAGWEVPKPNQVKTPGKHSDNFLQTMLFPQDLTRKMRGIYDDFKLKQSETGVNALFLAFGFVEWYDSGDSNVAIQSPLLLCPIEIGREFAANGQIKYYVNITDSELILNPCLIEAFKRSFQLKLPDLPEDGKIEDYFNQVSEAIRINKNWCVRRFLTVGFFHFAKIAMHQDLGDSIWDDVINDEDKPCNKILFGEQRSGIDFPEDYSIDQIEFRPKLPLLIDNADVSQISAVIDALDGQNLVIEGPPGTGKSQTITNLIGAFLARGKKVLFVAEKRAALDVVRNRLERSNISPFCLELHSNKIKKTTVLSSLEDSIRQRSEDVSDQLEKIESEIQKIIDQIQSYVTTLHSPLGSDDLTPHKVIWSYLCSASTNPQWPNIFSKLRFPEAVNWNSAQLLDKKVVLTQYAENRELCVGNNEAISVHCWYGLLSSQVNSRAKVQGLIKVLQSKIKPLLQNLTSIPFENNFEKPNLGRVLEIVDYFSGVDFSRMKEFPDSINDELSEETNQAISSVISLLQELKNAEDCLRSSFDIRVWELENFSSHIEKMTTISYELEWPDLYLKDLPQELSSLTSQRNELNAIAENLRNFKSYGISPSEFTIDSFIEILEFFSCFSQCPDAVSEFKSPALLSASLRKSLEQFIQDLSGLQEEFRVLSNSFYLDRIGEAYEAGEAAKIILSSGFFRFLNPKFYHAKALYRHLEILPQKVNVEQISENLLRLQRFKNKKDELYKHPVLEHIGSIWQGLDTDIISLSKYLDWVNALAKRVEYDYCRLFPLAENILNSSPNEFLRALSLTRRCNEKKYFEFIKRLQNIFLSDESLDAIDAKIQRKIEKIESILLIKSEIGFRDDVKLKDLSQIHIMNAKWHVIVIEIDKNSLIRRFFTDEVKLECLSEILEYLKIFMYFREIVDEQVFLNLESKLSISQCGPKALSALVFYLHDKVLPIVKDLNEELKGYLSKIWNGSSLDKLTSFFYSLYPDELYSRVAKAIEDENSGVHLANFLMSRKQVQESNLAPLVGLAESGKLEFHQLPAGLNFWHASELIRHAELKFPRFHDITGMRLEEMRNRFRELEVNRIVHSRRRLRKMLAQIPVPEGRSTGKPSERSELGLVRHECAKKTKHLPIRLLLQKSGQAIQALKPCFMMSPIAISQYLTPGQMNFDVLIIDEASQVRPEDAFGAVLRAAQVIVVGDPKQLPPTSFFEMADAEVDDESEYETNQESILEMALQSFSAIRRLKWHYRSKHESLMAFSNYHFYDNDLTLFPSPLQQHPDFGLKLIEVDGLYQNSRNRIEADRVIELLRSLMERQPHSSIGVVAMNEKQRELISDILSQEALTDPLINSYISRWDAEMEPFFVKNLESVQGDERDIIIVSTVYGKDQEGRFFQRFGPINGQSGWRRLNVLFTRARCSLYLVSSLKASEIRTDMKSSRGVVALKNYLEFAGGKALVSAVKFNDRAPDSEFEQFVIDALQKEGFELVPQLGVAGFFIDIAVRHPSMPGCFVLGIECDGATYHSSRSARDRDKNRQEILESLGWRIHRIWSTDWFRDPEKEVLRVIEIIKAAIL